MFDLPGQFKLRIDLVFCTESERTMPIKTGKGELSD